MGNSQSNTFKLTQNLSNNILEQNQENCIAQTTNSASGNTVIINGSVIDGNVTGVTTVTNTDASCIITSAMTATIQDILESISVQNTQASTDLFNDFSFTSQHNDNEILQSVANNITQINQESCIASTVQATNNNYIYVGNSTIKGNFVGISSDSNSKASCTMSNTMSAISYNKLQANSNQTAKSTGMLVAIAGSIGSIILIIIIVVAVVAITFVGGASKGASALLSSTTSPTPESTTEDDDTLIPPKTTPPINEEMAPIMRTIRI